jgi:ribulose-phosphate 3-epimerase
MKVAPSILSADFTKLEESVKRVDHATFLHVDVMDGIFVPNISFGPSIQKQIRAKYPDMVFDTHLMIIDPIKYIKEFADAGSDFITFHIEAKSDINETIDLIHSYGLKAGISIKPNTNPEVLIPYLDKLDLVLVMSVEPGFGGQKFMPNSLDKIKWLDEYKNQHNLSYIISVDGGINKDTYPLVEEAGANLAVMGSFLFKAENPNEWIDIVENNNTN